MSDAVLPQTTNPFEVAFDLPKPNCCSTGDCCKGVSPSTPFHQLLKRAGTGDEFAQNFFSIMVPYASHAEAAREVPGIVERSLQAVKQLDDFTEGADDIVFYRCRYLQADNRCGVHEDRPQLCRDYPDTPFVVMSPSCVYVPWAKACRKKYHALTDELSDLKEQKAYLKQTTTGLMDVSFSGEAFHLDHEAHGARTETELNAENWMLVLSLTPLFLASPAVSILIGE